MLVMSDEAEILALAAQRVGTVLHGKYHIDRVIGVGGMATVYAATHRNRKRFAIKMLHPEYSVRKDVRARFIREGYVANSVDHPGVVAVIDDDVDETGSGFLVMELLEGVTVEALCDSTHGPISLRAALSVAHQLLDVLEAAHQKSVVHRDIKPANLFLASDGRLKVLDFGIARLRETDGNLKSTRTGAMLGTPAFMAPEQAMAVPGEIDARTDVWAAGATLFTMLSAHFVHEGDNARQVMIRAATEPARSLGSIVPDLPATVVAIVARATAFERSERWPSAAEMRDAVRDVHRELFGADPAASDLRELIASASQTVETSPTEPSPLEISEERAAGNHVPRAAERASPHPPANRALQTTASTPVSTRGTQADRKPRWQLVALGGAAVALGAWLFLVPSKRPPQPSAVDSAAPAVPANLARTTTAEPAQAPPEPSAAATLPSAAASAVPEPSAQAPASRSSAPRTTASSVPRTSPQPIAPTPNLRKPEPARAAASPAPAAASAPPANPLKLELQ